MNIDFARKLELAYHQQCKALCDEFHLKQTGFDILMFLGNNPQYRHARDIVEIRKIKANLVSIHVDQLVDQGYLSRIGVPGDRRKVELVLNEKAKEVIEKGKVFQKYFFASLFIDIDETHQKIFKETLELMEKNIDCLLEEK
nr:MarR family winged helix-turn-helix transcriptional regulator [uncultured Faecalibacillus sp.]